MTTFTVPDRLRFAGALVASVGLIVFGGLHGLPRDHTPAANASPVVSVSYPTAVVIPGRLAEAIDQARQNTARSCPSGKAEAWAEVDQAGTVQDVLGRCT